MVINRFKSIYFTVFYVFISRYAWYAPFECRPEVFKVYTFWHAPFGEMPFLGMCCDDVLGCSLM